MAFEMIQTPKQVGDYLLEKEFINDVENIEMFEQKQLLILARVTTLKAVTFLLQPQKRRAKEIQLEGELFIRVPIALELNIAVRFIL